MQIEILLLTETYVMGMNKVASQHLEAKKENSVITLEKDYKRKYEGFDPNSPETRLIDFDAGRIP
jgi:N-acetylmuramoyl-L-alanine amidase